MSEDKVKRNDSLRTVQRAIDILNCFSLEKPELSLTDIANKINLAKSTTTRLLMTLEQNNLIAKNQNTLKYKLGHRLYYLGYLTGKSMKIREMAKPVMDDLRDLSKETVNLYNLERDFRVCMEQSEGIMSIRHLVKIGERLPLWAGAGGKALLAFQGDEFINNIFKTMDSGQKAIGLMKELKEIQIEHVAVSRDEREVGLSAVASPIFDIDGEVKSSLSLSGPSMRFTEEKVYLLKDLVKEAAQKISTLVGYKSV